MTFAIGTKNNKRAAFTLIELILVMAIFVIVFALVAPRLADFFRGRGLEQEAQRFLSLTQYGQSRAISEGVPIELWIDARRGRYGLEALSGYTESKTNPMQYSVADSVQISTSVPVSTLTRSNYWTQTATYTRGMAMIRFQPDGAVSETSPQFVYLKQEGIGSMTIAEDPSHRHYEIRNANP